jgi:ferredoxin
MIPNLGARVVLDSSALSELLAELARDGRELIGPTVRDGAIVLDRIRGLQDLPRGVGDVQAPGHYRLRERGDDALFGYAASPHSWKRELLVPRVDLVRIRRSKDGLAFEEPRRTERKVAFVGARACEIAAIRVQDHVLREGDHPDADYAARRAQVFVLAVHCGEPAGTCFCVSMQTGPVARGGYDLAATEVLEPAHIFVLDIGTEAGRDMVGRVRWREPVQGELASADAVVERAAGRMGRHMETEGIHDLLLSNLEHPRWDDVAARCLGCANCTMSCPTCFCTTVEDTTDLSGDEAVRTRRWDSCFTVDFAYVHGGNIRPTLRARYRQWLTHKVATWYDQFGESGCVGCGRCITWCPVGIDITEEVAAIRQQPDGTVRRSEERSAARPEGERPQHEEGGGRGRP